MKFRKIYISIILLLLMVKFGFAQSISTSIITPNVICAGSDINVPYTKTGVFNNANVFTAQLSNNSGSFSTPVNIGTLNSNSNGVIAATIPAGTIAGTGYRIRVVSSIPAVTGSLNSNGALTINDTTKVVLSISSSVPLANVCNNTSITFSATSSNAGTSQSYLWKKNGSNVGTNQTYTNANWLDGDVITCQLTTNATCPYPNPTTKSKTVNVESIGGNTWRQRSPFPVFGRSNLTGFTINNKIYLGTGIEQSVYKQDMWRYDTETDTWSQIADYPHTIASASSFTIGTRAFMGLGTVDNYFYYKDLYEYLPGSNTWILRTVIPAEFGGRSEAMAFSAGNYGYIVAGIQASFWGTQYLSDMWQYDPLTNVFTEKAGFPGGVRRAGYAFGVGNKGYAGGGVDVFGGQHKELYEYDPGTNSWTQKATYPGSAAWSNLCASGPSSGFVGLGWDVDGNAYANDFWEYNPANNIWMPRLAFPSVARYQSVGFSVGSKIFSACGHFTNADVNDFWEYTISGRSIKIGAMSNTLCEGATYNIPYSVGCANFNGPNNFTVQLSNQYGVFDNPVNIGSVAAAGSGSIAVTLPIGITGNNFRMRIVGSSPLTYSTIYESDITIKPKPVVNATVTPATTVCQGTLVTLSGTGAISYSWNNGVTNNVPFTANTVGSTNYTVTGTDVFGCTNTSTKTITVNAKPTVGSTVSPASTVCQGTNVTLNGTGAISYTWSNGITNAVAFTANNLGNTTYTVTGTNPNGCTNTATRTITVNANPTTPTITASGPTSFCTGGSVVLNSNSTTGNQWYLNGSSIFSATFSSYNAAASGNYSVKVTSNGCTSAESNIITVTSSPIPATPVISPQGPTTICFGASVSLIANSTTGIQWRLNGNPISGATNQVYVATQSGLYTAVKSNVGCTSSVSNTIAVTVNYTPTPYAVNQQLFTGTATIANLSAYGNSLRWYFDQSGGSSLLSSTSLVDGHTYYVTQTLNSCESERIAVLAKRIGNAAQTFCDNSTIADLVSTPSVGSNSNWYTSATGGVALSNSTTLTSGNYYVEQSASNGVETLTSSFLPAGVAIQNDGKIFVTDFWNGILKRLNNDGTGLTNIATGLDHPSAIAFEADGKILVSVGNQPHILRMNNDGTNITTVGSGFTSIRGIAVQPDGKIIVSDNLNNSVKRMNADGSNIVTLASGLAGPRDIAVQADGKILIADGVSNSIKRMDNDGTNMITLATGFNLPTDVMYLPDGKLLVSDFGNDAIKRMNADGTGIETIATGIDGSGKIAMQADGKILALESNQNNLKRLTLNLSTRVPVNVTINPLPNANISSTSTHLACFNPSSTLTASGGSTYQWNAQGGNATSSSITVTDAGTYTVLITSTDGCTASATQIITSNFATPIVNINLSTTVLDCNNNSILLTASGSSGVSYMWNATTVDPSNVSVLATTPGTYTVTAIFNNNGCTATSSTIITSDNTIPDATLTASVSQACTNQNIVLSVPDAGAGASYSWGGPSVVSNNANNISITTPLATGDFNYFVTISNSNGCTAVGQVLINVTSTATWYQDNDNDGYGNAGVSQSSCVAPLGYVSNSSDCNDNDNTVYQSNLLYTDFDGDGYDAGSAVICYGATVPNGKSLNTLGSDCDDNNTITYQNLSAYVDADGDNYTVGALISICSGASLPGGYTAFSLGNDCDDNNFSVYQSNLLYTDVDGDGYDAGSAIVCYGAFLPLGTSLTSNGTDCDDNNNTIYQSNTLYLDADGDGYDAGTIVSCYGTSLPAGTSISTNGSDCDDNNNAVYQNMNAYVDTDGDGYTVGTITFVCAGASLPAGYTATSLGEDCDDANNAVYQSQTLYIDADGDGYDFGTTIACYGASLPAGTSLTTNGSDCDDNNNAVYQNLNAYIDDDGDGYTVGTLTTICAGAILPAGYTTTSLGEDCDDNNNAVYQSQTLYVDADGDGYDFGTTIACYGASIPAGTSLTTNGSDCDDNNNAVYQNMNAYVDLDGDGYTVGTLTTICAGVSLPVGYVATSLGEDCDDNNNAVFALPLASVISASGTTNFCQGGEITLTGNNNGVWNTMSVSASIIVNTSGDYYVTSSNSCGSVTSNHIIVTVNALPNASITGASNFCANNSATLNAGSGFSSYLWSTGSTSATTLVTQSGTYSVTVTNAANCSASTSVTIAPCVNTVPLTQLRSIDCGKTYLVPNAQIVCNIVAGASNYEWEFRNVNNNQVYATKITNSYFIAPDMVNPILQWNTQYNCRIRAKVGGIWGNYGNSCLVGLMQNPILTGVPATSLRPQFCGVTLSLNSTISCLPIIMGSFYQFEFTDMATNQIINKQVNGNTLLLSTVSPSLQAGNNYKVRVRGLVYNTWSEWSNICNIAISTVAAARESAQEKEIEEAAILPETDIIINNEMKLNVYPNPLNDASSYQIISASNNLVNVSLFDARGSLVWQKQIQTNTNHNLFANELSPGVYFITFTDHEGKVNASKLVKTN